MKGRLAILLGVISLLSTQVAVAQQFTLEWEWDGLAYYCGDMDRDGVGEFAIRSDPDTTRFYDARDHSLKWTTTGRRLSYYWFQTDRNPHTVFPCIDYTGDSVSEILYRPTDYDGDGLMIVDVVDNSVIFELSHPEATDVSVQALADVDGDGWLELVVWFDSPSLRRTYVYYTGVQVTGVNEGSSRKSPPMHRLSQNYPNPFHNSTTSIEYAVQKPSKVSIRIYNSAGQFVRILVDENKREGSYAVSWDGRDDEGQKVAGGTYFYELQVDDYSSAKKAIMLK
jgi:hypothetical protein